MEGDLNGSLKYSQFSLASAIAGALLPKACGLRTSSIRLTSDLVENQALPQID